MPARTRKPATTTDQPHECAADTCELPEYEPRAGLCFEHFITCPDLREAARHDD